MHLKYYRDVECKPAQSRLSVKQYDSARAIAFGFRDAGRNSFERARLQPCRNMAQITDRL
jgi:hypothetical protein